MYLITLGAACLWHPTLSVRKIPNYPPKLAKKCLFDQNGHIQEGKNHIFLPQMGRKMINPNQQWFKQLREAKN